MFDAEKFRGFINTLTVNTRGLTDEAAVAALVRTAEVAKDRVIAAAPGHPPTYRQIVDNVEAAPLEAVRPDGVIVFAWSYASDVVANVYELLVQRSPRVTGEYIAGIILLVDGEEYDDEEIPSEATDIRIVASVPYARRLEVGKRKDGTPFVVQVEPHIVEETAYVARSLYGDLARFDFGYTDLNNPYQIKNPAGWRRKRHILETYTRYPSIIIAPRTA